MTTTNTGAAGRPARQFLRELLRLGLAIVVGAEIFFGLRFLLGV